ncbi:MAG: hypothetical protein ACC628_10590 [Pirellulaceae bacterium]
MMLKTVWCLISLATLVCSIAGFVVAQPPISTPTELLAIEYGDDMIDAVGGGDLGEIYDANSMDGETCTGPVVNCASGPSPYCDTGDCSAITSITVPTCVENTAWIGMYHCFQNGMECANGICPDGFMCFNSVEGACTDDWWWF